MSSVLSYIKQIPLNNGYFRSISGAGAASDASHIYTVSVNAATGIVASYALANGAAVPAEYIGLFRDMGVQHYDAVNDIVFRRVQVVSSTGSVTGIAGTGETSYGVYYIIVGRLGATNPAGGADTLATPSPFVRTG